MPWRCWNAPAANGISVGRGAQGRPWIFRDIVAAYHGGSIPPGPSLAEVVSVIERHAAWCVVDQGDERRALREMRKHIGWYLRGFAVGGPQRHALSMVSTLQELHDRLRDLDLDQAFPPAARGPRGRAGGEKHPTCPTAGWTTPTSRSANESACTWQKSDIKRRNHASLICARPRPCARIRHHRTSR